MIDYEGLVLQGLEGCFLDPGFRQNRMCENTGYIARIRDSPKFGPLKRDFLPLCRQIGKKYEPN